MLTVCPRSTCGLGCGGGDDARANSRPDNKDVRQIKVGHAGTYGVGFTQVLLIVY